MILFEYGVMHRFSTIICDRELLAISVFSVFLLLSTIAFDHMETAPMSVCYVCYSNARRAGWQVNLRGKCDAEI